MSAMKVYHTKVGCVQDMFQRSTGHVDVSLVEYGEKGFSVPMHVPFGRSQVWGSEGSECKGRAMWVCDLCGDRTLVSEWKEAYNHLISTGGFDPKTHARLAQGTPSIL